MLFCSFCKFYVRWYVKVLYCTVGLCLMWTLQIESDEVENEKTAVLRLALTRNLARAVMVDAVSWVDSCLCCCEQCRECTGQVIAVRLLLLHKLQRSDQTSLGSRTAAIQYKSTQRAPTSTIAKIWNRWSGIWVQIFQINFRSGCPSDLSQNVVDALPCLFQSFCQVYYKSAIDCMRNANKCPKIPYSAMLEKMKKWYGIHMQIRITTKLTVDHF